MTWFLAGSAAVTVGTTYLSANSAANAGAKQAGAQSRAEGEAITKERLNTTIRNSYNTAFSQMQLGLKKKQMAEQGANISAIALAAKGDASLSAASTGSIGSSTAAVMSDIEMKKQAALDTTSDAFTNAVENYNTDLNMMVLNTDQSAPTPRRVEYMGPSQGEMLGGALLSGATQFASQYAMRKMSLGSGPSGAPRAASNVGTLSNANFGYNPSPRIALGNTSNFFSSTF